MSHAPITSLEQLRDHVGHEIGLGEWFQITAERVELFAQATGDHSWFHFDGERTAAAVTAGELPGPMVHGFLLLSMGPLINGYHLDIPFRHGHNYGMDRVRFPQSVVVGQRVRCRTTLVRLDELEAERAVHLTLESVVEIEGEPKPGCVSVNLIRWYLA